jgi:hypothetical protein
MRALVLYGWYGSLALEAGLCRSIARERTRFLLWIAVDLVLSLILVGADRISPRHVYPTLWFWFQVPLLLLLIGAAVEQMAEYMAGARSLTVMVGVVGYTIFFTAPRDRMAAVTLAVSACLMVLLLCRWAWDTLSLRGSVMVLFLFLNAVAYLALLLGSQRFNPSTVVMIGQAACMGAWWLDSIRRAGAAPDSVSAPGTRHYPTF